MKKTAATVSVILISLLFFLAGCGSRNNEQTSGGIEVRNNGQYIQWTTGDGQWHDLVDIKENYELRKQQHKSKKALKLKTAAAI